MPAPLSGALASAPSGPSSSLSAAFLPLLFENNQGQKDRRVQFFARQPGFNLFLTSTSLVTVLSDSQPTTPVRRVRAPQPEPSAGPARAVALHMQFVNANASTKITPVGGPATRINLYEGNRPLDWRRQVPAYTHLRYKNLYKDTDMWLSSANGTAHVPLGLQSNPFWGRVQRVPASRG